MIVLDTNVVSELMKASPAPAVLRWCRTHPLEELFLTTVTQAEILLGIAHYPSLTAPAIGP